jgi:predicted GNAT family N-acyltransferase
MPFAPDHSLVRLTAEKIIKPFDCGDQDLNDFLHNDSINHMKDLLSVSYLLESPNNTIAFFSLLNDKIRQEDVEDKTKWNRFRKQLFPNSKRFISYPAMKIGRLAVCTDFQKGGIGKIILDYLKLLFISNNRTGCRFITVDAYAKSIGFYQKNGFIFLTEKDEGQDTRLMYFDLKTLTS